MTSCGWEGIYSCLFRKIELGLKVIEMSVLEAALASEP